MADRPSDRAIAAAFLENYGMLIDETDCTCDCCNILRRARSLDAAAPAQAMPEPEKYVEGLSGTAGMMPGEHRAFVEGAKWWEHRKTGATMWHHDQNVAFAQAVEKYGPYTPATQPVNTARRPGSNPPPPRGVKPPPPPNPPAPQPATAGTTAEHWRRAIGERAVSGLAMNNDWIEQRARELAQEGE